MDYIERREKDPEYLKNVIAQRQIVIEQRQRQKKVLQSQISTLNDKILQLQNKSSEQQSAYFKQTTNLKKALKQYENLNKQLKNQKNQLEFQYQQTKNKIQEINKQHMKEIYKLKNDFDGQKQLLNSKIVKLEKNLSALNYQYKIEESIQEDKQKIIQDANRDLRGFANQHQQRMIIVQNQQLTIEIQYQSRQITSLLQKNQKMLEEIKQHKSQLDIHKNIENDLVKRSSLAQNLIKQLNHRYKQLQAKLEISKQIIAKLQNSQSRVDNIKSKRTQQSQVSSSVGVESRAKQFEEAIAKLKFENAKLNNYNHFLQNNQKSANKKYQTLGQIMGQYLESLLYFNPNNNQVKVEGTSQTIPIDINSLKQRDLKQWKPEQTEVVLNLLLVQIKPYISAQSLATFPQARNIKVSFIQENNKESISLPKIVEQYEKAHERQTKRNSNRFKDIPVDISTKILRSNLREWGQKINLGSLPRNKKYKSKSIVGESDRSMY